MGHFRGAGSISGLMQWVKGSGFAAAMAHVKSLAWVLPYATGAGEKKTKQWLEKM